MELLYSINFPCSYVQDSKTVPFRSGLSSMESSSRAVSLRLPSACLSKTDLVSPIPLIPEVEFFLVSLWQGWEICR